MASRKSKKTWLIVAILIIAVGSIVGIALSGNTSSPPAKAPDFTLPIMTGGNITLSKLEGTPVVINFWATTCGYCVVELPYFEVVAQDSEGEIKVVAINVGDSASKIQEFFGDYQPTMIVASDRNGEAFVNYCQKYNNTREAIPFTLFVDSEGIVQYVKIGAFQSEAELWDTLHDVFGITIPQIP